MRGFLRRDLDLMIPNLKIYGGIFAIMLVVSFFTSLGLDFFAIYACIFTFSGMLGLFSYDEANHWQAYAAAAPNGRRSQVEARYALAFLFSGGVTLVLLIADLVSPDGRGMMGMPFFYEWARPGLCRCGDAPVLSLRGESGPGVSPGHCCSFRGAGRGGEHRGDGRRRRGRLSRVAGPASAGGRDSGKPDLPGDLRAYHGAQGALKVKSHPRRASARRG